MKRNFSFRFIMLALVAVLFTVTSCKDYDDDIKKIEAALEAYKAGAANDLKATKAELEKKITDLKGDVTTVAGKVKALEEKVASVEANAATKKELEDAKKELMAKLVSLETFNAYKAQVDAKLADLEAKLAKAATKDEVKALEDRLNAKIAKVEDELGKRIAALEGVLKLVNGESEVLKEINARLDGIDKSLEDHLAKINENKAAIEALKTELQEKYDELKGLIEANKTAIENLDAKVERYKKELDDKDKELEKMIGFNAANILTLSKQLEGLTFIPTRGLPSEKTMKLYYFAGDYTADHVLMYRVSPSNAKLGEDFTIESLNFQITTRSADDGVEDHSSKVDVHINGEVTQKGDIIYIPVHIKGAEACEVFGNDTWWGNEFFHGDNVLEEANFGPHVVMTVDEDATTPNVNYGAKGGKRGLSIVVTALTNDIKRKEGQTPAKLRVKSTEHVNTQLIPTQIKLAEVVGEKGLVELGKPGKPVLTSRLLKRTLAEATTWANEDEAVLGNDEKNWNVLMWSGTPIANAAPIQGEIDLYDYVTSFYYPQDGGDYKNEKVVTGDPFRHFYNEFGAFGEPYTDKPVYAKPVYEFEQVAYEDDNHNIVIIDGNTNTTHVYTTIEGSKLKVKADQISASNNKKVIVKVTQVNSKCDVRQPVGYLVVKIVESTTGWSDARWTFDFTQDKPEEDADEFTSYRNIPYYHKMFGTDKPVGGQIVNFENANDNTVGARWMNPLNAKNSWGISNALPNPGDINPILKQLPTINSAAEFKSAYIINGDNSEIIEQSFEAADYNHVNDTENVDATGVDEVDAFDHVLIRYEFDANSFIVYVDDKAPAGDYSITYKLQYKTGNVQQGRDLYLTFKFRVALREISVSKAENAHNWIPNTDIIRAQYARIQNTIAGGYEFLSENGYKVDLTEAFKLVENDKSNILITTEKIVDSNSVEPGEAPQYRARFEFVYDQDLVDAGFVFKRDDKNYLTQIYVKDQPSNIAAWIARDADGWERLRISISTGGDRLYSYLMSNHRPHSVGYPHNMLTTDAEDSSLERVDDMEKLLKVRMVTDINHEAPDTDPNPEKFANNNYYYIKDFAVKFERALRVKFTTVVLTDKQDKQTFEFNFHTRDTSAKIYRGLFDHGDAGVTNSQGIGHLVARFDPSETINGDAKFAPKKLAQWYGLEERLTFPLRDDTHIDYKYMEVSNDKGATWQPIPKDMTSISTHHPRFIDIVGAYDSATHEDTWTVEWQGNLTGITSEIWFRIPVLNKTAIQQGFNGIKGNPATLVVGEAPNGLWATFRRGYAGVKGYAVFKIVPRPGI